MSLPLPSTEESNWSKQSDWAKTDRNPQQPELPALEKQSDMKSMAFFLPSFQYSFITASFVECVTQLGGKCSTEI